MALQISCTTKKRTITSEKQYWKRKRTSAGANGQVLTTIWSSVGSNNFMYSFVPVSNKTMTVPLTSGVVLYTKNRCARKKLGFYIRAVFANLFDNSQAHSLLQ